MESQENLLQRPHRNQFSDRLTAMMKFGINISNQVQCGLVIKNAKEISQV